MSQTVLYCRVSTSEQTIHHQATQAKQAGFEINNIVADEGVSGVNVKLADRPQGRRLFDMLRRGDTLVIRWLDRLGRNYDDVRDNVQAFMRQGVVVKTVINGMTFDGTETDPMRRAVQDAMLAFMAAMGQAQAEATKEAQKAGIAHAKTGEDAAYRGRKPSFSRDDIGRVDEMLASGATISLIAEATGLSRQAVYRIRDERAAVEAALQRWNGAR